jgi:D-glycero-alpha-D-manno-heptose-7-phosphate kinase
MRISFLGGGTDYPEYFRLHGGATLATAINKHTFVTIHPRSDLSQHRIRVGYSKTEVVNMIDEIQHPSARECLRFLKIDEPIEITTIGEMPARTGLGTSSAFTVGLLHALYAHRRKMVSTEQLAREAVYVEREMIGERVGLQDQYTCAIGGLLHLQFSDENRVSVTPIILPSKRLEEFQSRLMLFYTNAQRTAHEVLAEQMERTKSRSVDAQLSALHSLVNQGIDVLCSETDLRAFGEILHTGWMLKKQLSDVVSNSQIDSSYECARRAGAIGGKLLGAGGGGFLLFFVEPEDQPNVRLTLAGNGLREVSISIAERGSRIVFYEQS